MQKLVDAESETLSDELSSDGFVDVSEAARFLNVSRGMVYNLMYRGELPFSKIGKCRRIPRRGLRQFAEKSIVALG